MKAVSLVRQKRESQEESKKIYLWQSRVFWYDIIGLAMGLAFGREVIKLLIGG